MKVKFDDLMGHRTREIRTQDFTSIGFEHEGVKWDKTNNWVVDLPEPIAKYLIDLEPSKFSKVKGSKGNKEMSIDDEIKLAD